MNPKCEQCPFQSLIDTSEILTIEQMEQWMNNFYNANTQARLECCHNEYGDNSCREETEQFNKDIVRSPDQGLYPPSYNDFFESNQLELQSPSDIIDTSERDSDRSSRYS